MLLSLKNLSSLSLFILFIGFQQVSAQEGFLNNDYDWDAEMETFEIPDSLKNEPQIFFKKVQLIEFASEEGKFLQLEVVHEIIWLNSDDAIDQRNKVYVPMRSNIDLRNTKARVVTPDGKITELGKDDIHEIVDEDENKLHYFAFKGIEIGSFIEYFYIAKSVASYNGSRKFAQELAPVFNYQFDLITPEHLIFETKSYNGFGDLDEDSMDEEHQHLTKSFAYIPKFVSEDEAYKRPNMMAVVYKLDENTGSNQKDMVTYSEVANTMVTGYSAGTKADMKVFKKMFAEANVEDAMTEEQKIRKLENYIKKNYAIVEAYIAELEDFSYIYKNKGINPRGFMKFMAIASDELDIKYNFVMTANRKSIAFDPKYQAYNYLQKYLMYFSGVDKYLDLDDRFSTLGLIDYDYVDTYGVFFKKVEVGGIVSATSKIKPIIGPSAEESHSDMDLYVKVEDDFSTLNFDLNYATTGYNASPQVSYGLINPEDEIELNEALVKWIDEDMVIKEVTPENKGYDNYGVKPLIINGKFSIDKYIVSVRDKYLIKLGLFIGPQAEMYQDGVARKYNIDTGFRKHYHRVLKFEVPEGYQLTNLETIQMNIDAKEADGKVYASFISTYTLEGNVLTVTCDEAYHKVHYPASQYEDYRTVINAAADFNKIVIYLETK